MVEEPICAGGNCRDFGRECRARYARKRSLSLVSSLFLAAMLIRLSLENQQPFPRSLSLSNALSLSLLLRRTNRWRARLRARDGEQKPRGTSGDEPGDGESTGDVRRHVGTAARVGGELSGIYRRPRRVDVLD